MRYYLTKSNPDTFKLEDFLDTSPTEGRWTVCKDAKPGDTLFIALSGKKAGIYAIATITSLPTYGGEDPDFWVSPEEAKKPRWRAEIRFSLIRLCPLMEQNIIAIPELKRVPKLLHRQGASCHLTEKEAKVLDRLSKTP